MKASNLNFSIDAQLNWHNILVGAIQQKRLAPLLNVVLATYGDNQALQAAYAQYQAFIDQGGDIGLLTPGPADGALQPIETGGGTFVAGSVQTAGGTFIGRDQVVQGDIVQG